MAPRGGSSVGRAAPLGTWARRPCGLAGAPGSRVGRVGGAGTDRGRPPAQDAPSRAEGGWWPVRPDWAPLWSGHLLACQSRSHSLLDSCLSLPSPGGQCPLLAFQHQGGLSSSRASTSPRDSGAVLALCGQAVPPPLSSHGPVLCVMAPGPGPLSTGRLVTVAAAAVAAARWWPPAGPGPPGERRPGRCMSRPRSRPPSGSGHAVPEGRGAPPPHRCPRPQSRQPVGLHTPASPGLWTAGIRVPPLARHPALSSIPGHGRSRRHLRREGSTELREGCSGRGLGGARQQGACAGLQWGSGQVRGSSS